MSQPADFTAILARWEAERPDAAAMQLRRHDPDLGRAGAAGAPQSPPRCARPGSRPATAIAVLDLNHPSCLELTLACAQIGAANAVVNFRLAPPEIVYVINDAKARLLFVGPEFAGAVEQLRDKLADRRAGDAHRRRRTTSTRPGSPRSEPDPRVHPAAPDDCFVQLYTSGTTGFPKGAMLTHRGMLAHAAQRGRPTSQLGADDRVQVAMPLFHVGGTSYALLAIACRRAHARCCACPTRPRCWTCSSASGSPTRSSCPRCWRR